MPDLDIPTVPPSSSTATGPGVSGSDTLADTTVDVDQLQPDPHNRRRHDDRNVTMVADAMRHVGAARSIVVDEDDMVLAGNGVIQAAKEAGITKVRIIDADGTEVIAVRRRGLTPDQKRALAIYDNRTAELSAWNFDQLQADKAAGLDLQPFWTDGEQAIMFGTAVEPTWSGMPEFEQDDQKPWWTVLVHFTGPADLDAFAKAVDQLVTAQTKFIWYPRQQRIPKIDRMASTTPDDEGTTD
jgi:hypothetical protein